MKKEKQLFGSSLLIAGIWVGILWAVELIEIFSDTSFSRLGIYPRHAEGLVGILTAPFVHGNIMDHLLSNSISLLPLAVALFFFYRPIAWQVVMFIQIASGVWVWIAARTSLHIGVSGIIYGLAFFLFFSGVFRKELVAMAVALVVVFFHGSMVWGTLPFFTPEHVSWESHLFGGIAGVVAAFFMRKQGLPPQKRYDWEDAPDKEDEGFEYWNYQKNNPPPSGFQHPD